MKTLFATALLFAATSAFAQDTPRTPQTAQTAKTPATPQTPKTAVTPQTPRREGQPINVKVELTITEEGGDAPAIKKTVSAVVGDGYMGYVREQGMSDNITQTPGPFDRMIAPLNLDALPTILPGGKIRVQCTIQYAANQRTANQRRINTDIKQNLTLILESGKPLVVSQATDPLSDRQVTVEVKATVLK
jgi:hypothetical protein